MPQLVEGFTVANGDIASAIYLTQMVTCGGVTVFAAQSLIGNNTTSTGVTGTANWGEIGLNYTGNLGMQLTTSSPVIQMVVNTIGVCSTPTATTSISGATVSVGGNNTNTSIGVTLGGTAPVSSQMICRITYNNAGFSASRYPQSVAFATNSNAAGVATGVVIVNSQTFVQLQAASPPGSGWTSSGTYTWNFLNVC